MATKIPFTESQWEELENQALVFKYLAANVPVPPHLLFLIKRPFLFSSSSSSSSPSSFFSPTLSPHFGWNVYEMGMGRKIDAEPGRCRRTDGKKWRCSKEAYPDSKYCERHMHRGKNRSSSRKPLPLTTPQFTPNLFLDSSLSSSRFQTHPLPLFYSNGNTKIDTFPLKKTCLRVSRRRRSGYMDDFFSIEPSGSIKSCSGLAMEDDEGSCRGINSFSKEGKQPHCFIRGTDLGTRESPLMLEEKLKQRDDDEDEEEQRSKRLYRFLDEWPASKSSVSTSLFI